MNDRDFITSIRDQCNTQLGGGDTGTPGAPPSADAVAITQKPVALGDLGGGHDAPSEKQVSAGEIIGYTLTFRKGAIAREIAWFGKPGAFWNRTSWAIFDSAGVKIMGADNVLVAGTLGTKLDTAALAAFGDGPYTFGVTVNGSGNLAIQFNQRP